MKKKEIIHDFTQGNLPVQMLQFASPFMLSNVLQVLYGIIDMAVVGKFIGSDGLSAVATASQLVNFMTMFCLGFCNGGQVLIAQYVGAKKREELQKCIGTLTTLSMCIGVVMGMIGFCAAKPLLHLLQTPPEAFDMATSYLRICSAGVLFSYGYNIVSSVLRGEGESLQPCIYIAIASVSNLLLDLLFVSVFNRGVAGAAYATIMGQAISFIWSVIYLVRHKEAFGFDFKPHSFRIDRQTAFKLISLGIPFAFRSAAVHISMLFVTGLVNTQGTAASAVFGVGIKVDDIARKISMGCNYSCSAMVGQNFAAGNHKRTKQVVYFSWLYSGIIYLVFFFIYIFNINAMFGLFTDEAEVLALAPVFVKAIVWSFPATTIMRGTNGFIGGIGNSGLTLLFAIIDGFVLRIGLSWMLGEMAGLGLYGYFLGYGLATYGTAVPGAVYFFSGKWKKRKAKSA